MSDLRPTLFLAQLPNLLAGNISIVHGVVGSSRTFLGEESAGVDAVRIAQARIAAGQSELTLVGGAYHGTRWDVLLDLRSNPASRSRTPSRRSGIAARMAALRSATWARSWCWKAAIMRERAARVRARGFRRCRPTATGVSRARSKRRCAGNGTRSPARSTARMPPSFPAPPACEPATSAERTVLKEIGLPVRNTGTYIGHGVEAQFIANLGIACAAIEHGKLFAPAGTGDGGASPAGLSQVVVTSVGNWRGEGLALIERVD